MKDFLGNEIKKGMLCIKIGYRYDKVVLELAIITNVTDTYVCAKSLDGKKAKKVHTNKIIVETGFKEKLI